MLRLLLLAAALVAAAAADAPRVLNLNDTLYDELASSGALEERPLFVLFYRASCPHCRAMVPTWANLGVAAYENPRLVPRVCAAQCGNAPKLCAKLGIGPVPKALVISMPKAGDAPSATSANVSADDEGAIGCPPPPREAVTAYSGDRTLSDLYVFAAEAWRTGNVWELERSPTDANRCALRGSIGDPTGPDGSGDPVFVEMQASMLSGMPKQIRRYESKLHPSVAAGWYLWYLDWKSYLPMFFSNLADNSDDRTGPVVAAALACTALVILWVLWELVHSCFAGDRDDREKQD